jgi:hypothetical protein
VTLWNPPSPHYRGIVLLAVSMPAALIAAALLFPSRIDDARSLLLSCGVALGGVLAIVVVSHRLPAAWRALLRAIGTIALVSFLFSAISGVQHLVFSGWFDAQVIRFETAFTGIELSLWMERFTHAVLTEWMMASYVLYLPLIPFTAWASWRYGGELVMYRYLFALLGANVLCDIGFVLYPVASQMYFNPGQYSVPLSGGPFTAVGEWMRATQHFPGGSLPSPHCAAGTVMLVTLLRVHRGWGLAALPFLVSILPSTVYGRYHYISDCFAGILVGLLMLRVATLQNRTNVQLPSSSTERIFLPIV